MLDNFTPEQITVAAKELRADRGVGGMHCLVEVSGGLTEENMADHLCPGQPSYPSRCFASLTETGTDVDILSTSSIHQGVFVVDFSLKIQPKSKAQATPSLITTGTSELNNSIENILSRARQVFLPPFVSLVYGKCCGERRADASCFYRLKRRGEKRSLL